ncbi:MAG: hypothetical protein NTX15_06810 [Candidatus Kapabacteria bacterium]|nr:hypothetical protein [Candidatus Kapabacteria bacterium]
MLSLLIASFLTLAADGPTAEQQAVNLYRFREAYVKATLPSVRDSIRQEVLHAIPDLRVDQEHGAQQVQLWDACCSMWDVVEMFEPAGHVEAASLPKLSMYEVDGVAFYRSDTAFNQSNDTMYTSSNALPGFGGVDVYFSPLHYYAVIDEFRWIGPYNYGDGINTGADEFGLRREDTTMTFFRAANGTVRKYRATPRTVLRNVEMDHTCTSTSFVYLNVLDCRDLLVGSLVFDDGTRNVLPPTSATLQFRCCQDASPRTFIRCNVSVGTLSLQDTDIRTHQCKSSGVTSAKGGEQVFGFSIFEDLMSAETAFRSVVSEYVVGVTAPTYVRIERAPGHLTQQIDDLVRLLTSRRIKVDVLVSSDARTTIALRAD